MFWFLSTCSIQTPNPDWICKWDISSNFPAQFCFIIFKNYWYNISELWMHCKDLIMNFYTLRLILLVVEWLSGGFPAVRDFSFFGTASWCIGQSPLTQPFWLYLMDQGPLSPGEPIRLSLPGTANWNRARGPMEWNSYYHFSVFLSLFC